MDMDYAAIEEQILGGTTARRGNAVFVRGEGCWLFEAAGRRYLDLSSAQGVAMLGHCHPRVSEAIAQQARTLMLCPNYLYNDVAHVSRRLWSTSSRASSPRLPGQ